MKLIVCIKQVPNTNEVRIDAKTGTMIRQGIPNIINPVDKNALEAALCIKRHTGADVTVITMGPPQADYALREVLAMGADEAVLLSDPAFAGADTWATSITLAAAMRKIADYDIIFCGHQAIDGDTAQVGPELAEQLDLPQVTRVNRIVELKQGEIVVSRSVEEGCQVIACRLPAVLTVVKELNTPRYPTTGGIVKAFDQQEVAVWSARELKLACPQVGLLGSATQVKKTFSPAAKGKGIILPANPHQSVQVLLQQLHEKSII